MIILNTPIVKITETNIGYIVTIKVKNEGFVENEPFPKTLEGLVSAMQLSTEVLAGKFFPARIITKEQFVGIEHKPKTIRGKI